jgi:hypothetical protein
MLVSSLSYSLTLKMVAESSSKTLVDFKRSTHPRRWNSSMAYKITKDARNQGNILKTFPCWTEHDVKVEYDHNISESGWLNRHSKGLWAGWMKFNSWQGYETFLFSKAPTPAL